MRRWFLRMTCPHTDIDEVYTETPIVEDMIAGIGRTEFFGHCQTCDRDVFWSETL